MTLGEAIEVCKEMQKWRRSEPPYDGDTPETHKEQPYSSQAFGLAIDRLIGLEETLDELQERVNKVEARNKDIIDKALDAHCEYCDHTCPKGMECYIRENIYKKIMEE